MQRAATPTGGWRSWARRTAGVVALSAGLAGAVVPALATPPAGAATTPLRILVTNDDGYSAPGINTVVQALRKLPHTVVTVVAPFTNESGQGSKTTPGRLVVTKGTTQSGYPAEAVHGYPVDTIIWAVQDHHVRRPDLVVSGINFGENIGPLANGSGTVGAARAALARGIPAIASSQGVDDGHSPDFATAARYVTQWITKHRKAIMAAPSKRSKKSIPSTNLNAPTCPSGTSVRGPVRVAQATSLGAGVNTANCRSSVKRPRTDVMGFVNGFVTLGPLAAPRSTSKPTSG